VVVRVPEIEQRARERPAAPPVHAAGQLEPRALHVRLEQRRALRRARLEERPCGLGGRRLVVVAALGRRRLVAARGGGGEQRIGGGGLVHDQQLGGENRDERGRHEQPQQPAT